MSLIACGFEAQSLANDAEGAGYRSEGVTPAIETSIVYAGSASLKAVSGTNAGVFWIMDGNTGMGRAQALDVEYRLVARFRLNGTPTTNGILMRVFSTTDRTTAVGSVGISTSRLLRINNSAGVLVASGATLSVDTWYQIEFRFKVVTGAG